MTKEKEAIVRQIDIIETLLADTSKLGTETEVYSRISGYYRSIKNWNKGKQAELFERTDYKV